MATELDSPTIGRGTDWGGFYATVPSGNPPFSPSSFGLLLFSQPDAESARNLIGAEPFLGYPLQTGDFLQSDTSGNRSWNSISFGDIIGTIAVDQLPPGSLVTVDSIGEDALYFFDELTGLPRLIGATEAADFLGVSTLLDGLTFGDIGGTISLDQFPAGTVATLDSIDEDGFYFFDNTAFAPKLLGKNDALTFLLPTQTGQDGKYLQTNAGALSWAVASGGSFLANHTARVDPSGNDSTGTIGDLGKPFLTAQGAFDKFVSTDPDQNYVLLVGNFNAGSINVDPSLGGSITIIGLSTSDTGIGNVTATSAYLSFVGLSIGTITFEATGTIYLKDSSCRTITFGTGTNGLVRLVDSDVFDGNIEGDSLIGTLTVQLENARSNGRISALAGSLNIHSESGTGFFVDCRASGPINVYGCVLNDNQLVQSNNGGDISIYGVGNSAGYVLNLGNVTGTTVSTSGNVKIYDQIVVAVNCNELTLVDSRVIGTNNATSTVYADVLLLPRYQMSVDFDATGGLKLVNDDAAPGNSQYYGTDSGGTKGYFDFPSGGTITLTGDVTGSGSGSFSTTLANTAVTPGTYGNGTNIPQITVDSKGRITAAAEVLAPLIPVNTSSTAHQFFTAYSSVDGTFTKAQPAFSDLSGTPTTLSGYGIADAQPLDSDLTAIAALTTTSFGRGFLPLADAAAARTYIGAGTSSFSGAFSALSGIPTTLSGYGITDAQPLDSDLTTIAGITATTDNFMVSVASAWASRTPAQVRTTLGLVIGTNVQAWDADLDTWASVTPGSGVATFLATPSSANLAAALTDETGSGAAVFATSPTLVTPVLGTPSSGNASNLTALNATQLTSGTVPLARLSGITTSQTSGIAASGANSDITSISTLTSFGTGSTATLFNSTGSLQFGGTTSSFPALKRGTVSSNGIAFRLADGSDYAPIEALGLRLYTNSGTNRSIDIGGFNANISLISGISIRWDASSSAISGTNDTGLARNAAGVVEINNGTAGTLRDLTLRNIISNTTGVKIATDATHKLGFWNAAPVVQPAAALQAALTNSTGGTQDGTLVDVTTTAVADPVKVNSNFTDVYALLDAMRTALVNTGLMKGAA